MCSRLKSFFILAGFLAVNLATAYADNLNNTTLPAATGQANKPNYSNAIAFGEQAGNIAGVAQACGQDTSLFITRVNEALDKIAISPADKVTATQIFQQSMQKAQATETQKQVIPCTQAVQDFNNLPLLRNDYRETVLPQLNPNMTNPNKNTAPPLPSTNNANNSIPAANANMPATQQQVVTATPSAPSNASNITPAMPSAENNTINTLPTQP